MLTYRVGCCRSNKFPSLCDPFPLCRCPPQMTEKLQDMENEAMSKIVELEKQLMQRNKDLESIRVRLPLRALTFMLSFKH